MKKVLKALAPLFVSLLILLLLEGVVRVVRPGINFQGVEQTLLRSGAYTARTHGLVPNASGVCFGVRVFIDESGCRKLAGPERYDASWLILGDSVAFGVGVETEQTYAQLLQNRFPGVRVRNTSVPGYSLRNYRDVLEHYLSAAGGAGFERVLLFLCLNDVDLGETAWRSQPMRPQAEGVLSFLRRHSKLYLFIKANASDRSKSYFSYDYQLYEKRGEQFAEALGLLDEVAETLRQRGVSLLVVVQPYEYQLREKEPRHLLPQALLTAFLAERGIPYVDAYEEFGRAGADADAASFYLYGDHAHFSARGHRVIFEAVMRRLGAGGAGDPVRVAR